jgi:murein DD-endopeptidase MepM/ murein hydrolase activator NlpD
MEKTGEGMRKGLRRILVPVVWGLITALIFQVSLVGAVDYNSRINQLRQEREILSRDIIRRRQKVQEKKREAERISREIRKIDGDISVTQKRIDLLEEQIDEIRSQIKEKVGQIREKEDELRAEKDKQDQTLRAIYEVTDEGLLYVLFSSSDISEIIDRSSYLEALEARISQTIEEIAAIKDELIRQKEELKQKDEKLNSLKKQQEAYRKGLQYQKEHKDNLLYRVKATQKSYEKLLAEARRAYQDVNSELYRIMEAARRRAARGGSRKVGNIEFGWPFSGAITAAFGVATPVQSFHTGLDIDGVIGDPIVASADGKVTFTGGNKTWGYGYYVIIDHGSGVTSWYGHLSGFDVSPGDEVKRGARIGFMGNTGFAIAMAGGDGSHLHFEIREDGVPVNPYLYLP